MQAPSRARPASKRAALVAPPRAVNPPPAAPAPGRSRWPAGRWFAPLSVAPAFSRRLSRPASRERSPVDGAGRCAGGYAAGSAPESVPPLPGAATLRAPTKRWRAARASVPARLALSPARCRRELASRLLGKGRLSQPFRALRRARLRAVRPSGRPARPAKEGRKERGGLRRPLARARP